MTEEYRARDPLQKERIASSAPLVLRRLWEFAYAGPSSQAPLLGPGPLRTGRETFVLIRLKPCERLFEGDAALIRKGADGEPCRGTLDEVERGFPRSSNHPSQEGRGSEGASP